MANPRIRFNLPAFEQIRRFPAVDNLLKSEVDRVLGDVGPGYAGGVEPGRSRSRGYVVATAVDSILANRQNPAPLLTSLLRGTGTYS